MPVCAFASIVIGGRVSADDFITLCHLIVCEGLSREEDGEEFSPELRSEGQPLRLFDHQAIGGRFGALEEWCEDRGLPFTRTCAGYPGGWRAERVVFTGRGPVEDYPADNDGNVVATSETVDRKSTSELTSLMRISYAVFCLKTKINTHHTIQ